MNLRIVVRNQMNHLTLYTRPGGKNAMIVADSTIPASPIAFFRHATMQGWVRGRCRQLNPHIM